MKAVNMQAALGAALLAALLLLTGCDQTPDMRRLEGQAQGTRYQVSWWREGGNRLPAVRADLSQTLAEIDRELSTYRDDSWISRFNRSRTTDWQAAPASALHLLGIAREVHARSQGCFDPTVSPLFALWGFQDQNFRVPSDEEIERTLSQTGLEHLEIDAENGRLRKQHETLSIDLSAMGEGYSVDRIASALEARGIENYLAELGGDMRLRGVKPDGTPWRVGIERPAAGPRSAATLASLDDARGASINTSGTYRRFFDDNGNLYSHILDPRTGHPVEHDLVSATVFGQDGDAARSDAWATALLCLGRSKGMAAAEREGLATLLTERRGESAFESFQSPALQKSDRLTLSH